MRKIFLALAAVCAFVALTATKPVQAGQPSSCTTATCQFLNRGHVRGRIPVACISIPYIKEGQGEIAMYVLRDFNPSEAKSSAEGLQRQLLSPLFRDSKITGPVSDFCRNKRFFEGGNWVVLCDGYHWGAVTGGALAYALREGKLPLPVHVGTHVH